MMIFRELAFEGTPEDLAGFLDGVDSVLCDGWRRDEPLEVWALEDDTDSPGTFHGRAYFCPQSDRHASAHLWIAVSDPANLFVQNIIPIDKRRLLYDEYNAIVQEFHDRFVAGPAAHHGIAVVLGPDRLSLEGLVPVTVFDKLVAFTRTANPHTGSDLPNDRERWQTFIIKSHETGCNLPREMLRKWLVEDKYWPEHIATDLADEYEFGRSLLAHEHATTA